MLRFLVYIELGPILTDSGRQSRAVAQSESGSVKDTKTKLRVIESTTEKGGESCPSAFAMHNMFCCNFHALTHLYRGTHSHTLFVCRLLSALIAVTFISAPEACQPFPITWCQI